MFSYFRGVDEMMAMQEPDDPPIQTDEPCPFCGQLVEWNGDVLYCEPCKMTWPAFDELRFDRGMERYRQAQAQRDEDADGNGDGSGYGSGDGSGYGSGDGSG